MARTRHGARTTHLSGSPQTGRSRRGWRMGGERERSWRAFADLGCIVGGGAVMFWIAARVDLLRRLLGSSTATDPAALRRAVLLLFTMTLALGLFGYRRWREASRSRA